VADVQLRKGARGKALVIDDSLIALEIIHERLTSAGFDVTVRSEPLGAGQWIAEHRPAFVLLDVEMPALSGDALAVLLKKRATTQDVCIILHSSLPRDKLAQLVRQCGASGAIEKTDDDDRFMRELTAIIGSLPRL
jgi:CheY-like chemotaxis protein